MSQGHAKELVTRRTQQCLYGGCTEDADVVLSVGPRCAHHALYEVAEDVVDKIEDGQGVSPSPEALDRLTTLTSKES